MKIILININSLFRCTRVYIFIPSYEGGKKSQTNKPSRYDSLRRELQASGLSVHGVALAAAELHPASRTVIARLEPAHGAKLPRSRNLGRTRSRRQVRTDLLRYPVQHRLVQ